jgi:hypothetical protein
VNGYGQRARNGRLFFDFFKKMTCKLHAGKLQEADKGRHITPACMYRSRYPYAPRIGDNALWHGVVSLSPIAVRIKVVPATSDPIRAQPYMANGYRVHTDLAHTTNTPPPDAPMYHHHTRPSMHMHAQVNNNAGTLPL